VTSASARALGRAAVLTGRYHVKIHPPTGPTVWRFVVAPLHVAYAACALAVLAAAPVVVSVERMQSAQVRVDAYDRVAQAQHEQLSELDRRAETLTHELDRIQAQDAEVKALIGATESTTAEIAAAEREAARVARRTPPAARNRATFAVVRARIAQIGRQSRALRAQGARVARLAHRIVRVRHLVASAQIALLAAVPSIDPIPNAVIASRYGFRLLPWPEFHHGVDLAADYGTRVHATADGVVVSAGFEPGGYGIKIDVDHGNGFHTWYAHLSRVAVQAGDRVKKSALIGYVGSTGASTGPHLHYQVMRAGKAIDPTPFLHGVPGSVLASLK